MKKIYNSFKLLDRNLFGFINVFTLHPVSFIFLTFLLPFSSHASVSRSLGAISTATGGSGRAMIDPSESSVLNPASIAFLRGYFLTWDYSLYDRGQGFTVSITDSLPDTVASTSIIYNEINGYPLDGPAFTQDIRLQLAKPLQRNFSIGLTGRHKADSSSNTKFQQTNLSIGGILAVSNNLILGLVLENLIYQDTRVPTEQRLTPGSGIGLSYNYRRILSLVGDLETATNNSLNNPTFSVGMNIFSNEWLQLRMGVRKALETSVDEYGTGLGFSGPKFSLNYGYLSSPQQPLLNRHSVDLAIPIW